jgi:hypothetical protein
VFAFVFVLLMHCIIVIIHCENADSPLLPLSLSESQQPHFLKPTVAAAGPPHLTHSASLVAGHEPHFMKPTISALKSHHLNSSNNNNPESGPPGGSGGDGAPSHPHHVAAVDGSAHFLQSTEAARQHQHHHNQGEGMTSGDAAISARIRGRRVS